MFAIIGAIVLGLTVLIPFLIILFSYDKKDMKEQAPHSS